MKRRTKYRLGKRKLSRESEEQSRAIARRLLTLAEEDIHKPATWKQVARSLSIHCFGCMDFAGCYMRTDTYPETAIIAVNDDCADYLQSRIWIHELAHHLLYEAAPPLPMEPVTHYYNDEAGGIAHRIACRVEALVLQPFHNQD